MTAPYRPGEIRTSGAPYKPGDQAVRIVYLPLSRSAHFRLVQILTVVPLEQGYSVTVGLPSWRAPEERRRNLTGPPGRPHDENRRPGPHRRLPKLATRDDITLEIIDNPTLIVDDHGVGLGLVPAEERLLRRLSEGVLDLTIQTQLTAALVGGQYADREIWTVDECADFLRIDKGTLYKWQKGEGEDAPPRLRYGKYVRFVASEVRAWTLTKRVVGGQNPDKPRRAVEDKGVGGPS